MSTSDDGSTDAAVIARSLGDPHAFAEIFDRHHDAMWKFVWTRVGDEEAANDLAAEVFRIAFEQRHDYDLDYDSAKPWLFGIAANLVRQHHRDRARRDEAGERIRGERGTATAPDPQGRLDRLDSTPVAEALKELPERDREPLLLYAWDDLAYEEIADALDVPVGTVRSRIHRARKHVRRHLDVDEPDAASRAEGSR
ncbi:MAG: RNA polymerase sigma factor [Nitriliruptorales bacterium]|nr:RNA polymerase sigma factor [Nitriliruptorales bacterium]